MNEQPQTCVPCRGLGTVYPKTGPAVRIDTLRSRVAATAALLVRVAAQLEDLHHLAYDRQHAQAEKVRGGTSDYALDTHGDQRARDAYRHLAQVTLDVAELVTEAAHDTARLLTEGSTVPVRRYLVSSAELAASITAQAQRIRDGDYVPHRLQPQPDKDTALETVTKKAELLQRTLDKVSRAVPGAFKQGNDDVLGQVRKLSASWHQKHSEKGITRLGRESA